MRLVVFLVPVVVAAVLGVLARDSKLVSRVTDRWDIDGWEVQVAMGVATFVGLMLVGLLAYLYGVAHNFPGPG